MVGGEPPANLRSRWASHLRSPFTAPSPSMSHTPRRLEPPRGRPTTKAKNASSDMKPTALHQDLTAAASSAAASSSAATAAAAAAARASATSAPASASAIMAYTWSSSSKCLALAACSSSAAAAAAAASASTSAALLLLLLLLLRQLALWPVPNRRSPWAHR